MADTRSMANTIIELKQLLYKKGDTTKGRASRGTTFIYNILFLFINNIVSIR